MISRRFIALTTDWTGSVPGILHAPDFDPKSEIELILKARKKTEAQSIRAELIHNYKLMISGFFGKVQRIRKSSEMKACYTAACRRNAINSSADTFDKGAKHVRNAMQTKAVL